MAARQVLLDYVPSPLVQQVMPAVHDPLLTNLTWCVSTAQAAGIAHYTQIGVLMV